ncbi:MAG: FecR domain-containing protein [Nitrosopumilus sp.]|nr:FecR domain-containing protein [Nitrosopumilus sp.]
MKYHRRYIKELMQKHIANTASDDEIAILLAALDLYSPDEISAMIDDVEIDLRKIKSSGQTIATPPFQEILNKIKKPGNTSFIDFMKRVWIEATVIFLFIAAAGLITWKINKPSPLQFICGEYALDDVLPTAPYSCKLMFPDGHILMVDSSSTGLIKEENGFKIYNWPDGLIEFKKTNQDKKIDSNGNYSISTSNGQQYRVILPDGTQVRLNAASSIRFPTSFSTNHFVEVKGEAFFDVPDSKKESLFIQTKDARISVKGTAFNINTFYVGTTATLFNGHIELKSGRQIASLKSGEQALTAAYGFYRKDSAIVVKKIDTSLVISWARPERKYMDFSLQEFVLDIGRWHDLEIVNINCVSKRLISISICYNTPIEELLRLFKQMGLRFNYAGKKISFCPPVFQTKKTFISKDSDY